VSPTYAKEIQTPEQGCGLDGLLRVRENDLTGILNAVDETVWNPAHDRQIKSQFTAENSKGKALCKAALQAELGLNVKADAPLFGVVSRLTEQKGLHLVLAVLDDLILRGGQLVVLGTGDVTLEAEFAERSAADPQSVAVRIGYDEAFAHRIFSATDVTLVPSRYEPCGLTQMYGLKYGSLPLVHRVGGLADTVVDCSLEDLADGSANGFVFAEFTQAALERAMRRALALYASPVQWKRVRQRAMQQALGWDKAAAQYLHLYNQLTS
jgi:starch synthase